MSKGTQTRERIVAMAAPLFNQKGFDGCSMQDIVAATGLEKGSLYGHFRNKEELSLAAFDLAWGATVRDRLEGMQAVPGVIDKLLLHVHNFATHSSYTGGCPLMNTITDSDDGNLALRQKAFEALSGWRVYLEGEVAEGQRRGELKPDLDPKGIVAVFLSLLEGAMALERVDGDGDYLAKAETHISVFLRGIALEVQDTTVSEV